MTPEHFQQIAALFHAVRGKTGEERSALLAQEDPELRRDVESLLAEPETGQFLDRPAFANDAAPTETFVTRLSSGLSEGAQLGPYRIEEKLGAGGMGEVFRAIDTRLGRAVAIKITQDRFSARFEREGRAIGSLNHPNICTLYDIGPNYLVMELVDGETLAARLKSGPIPLNIALQYAAQVTAALAEAHAHGIVHRDLKPGNIMVAKAGVKVLDFGLASVPDDPALTATGMVMGTPAYMAPEQREGKADARSDIYAFGRILYEMLTGEQATQPRKRLRTRRLESIVKRCLEAEPGRRWQSVTELETELTALRSVDRGTKAEPRPATRLSPKAPEKTKILLGEFENKTGDPVFDGILHDGLSAQLQQSPSLTLVPEQQVHQALGFMNRPRDTRLTPGVALEICERTGGAAVLEGSIAGLGGQYILWLRARNCPTGAILGQEQAQATNIGDALPVLTGMAAQIGVRLGESLSGAEERPAPLEPVTTHSLEALKAYTVSRQALFSRGFAAAIPHLQRAIAIDPQFATAHADLGFFYWNTGQTDLATKPILNAWELRDRVSERERLFIHFLYQGRVKGNLQKELTVLEEWTQTYPGDSTAWGVLGGWGTRGTGQYERGIRAAQEAIRIRPDLPFPYESLAMHSMCLGRLSDVAAALQRAAKRKLEIPVFLVLRYYLAFLQGDAAGMQREIERAHGIREAGDWISHHQAMVLAYSGQLRKARVLWRHAIELAQQAGDGEKAAIYEAAATVCEAHAGNRAEATDRAGAALTLGRGRDVTYAAAFATALFGDISESQKLAGDLAQRFPEDTPTQFEYLPTLHALFALSRKAPAEAIDHLQKAIPYDFAMPGTAFFGRFGGLYPVYVRGLAFMEAGRPREAATEFQKVLDHRGIVLADPIGAVAHLQRGRALARLGERGQARGAYDCFLVLWKDADVDIPVLKQAREEYLTL